MKLATHLNLVPRLRMSGVKPLFVHGVERGKLRFLTFTYEFA
jgi:hypothetical protein